MRHVMRHVDYPFSSNAEHESEEQEPFLAFVLGRVRLPVIVSVTGNRKKGSSIPGNREFPKIGPTHDLILGEDESISHEILGIDGGGNIVV